MHRVRRSLQFTNLFPNLATAEFPSIIDALCGRAVSESRKNMVKLLVFVKLQKAAEFMYVQGRVMRFDRVERHFFRLLIFGCAL